MGSVSAAGKLSSLGRLRPSWRLLTGAALSETIAASFTAPPRWAAGNQYRGRWTVPAFKAWARHLPRGAVKETEPMSRTFTLTADQRAQFERTGLLRLPGFFPGDIFAPMADAVWGDLGARFGIRRDDPAT